MKFRFCGDGDCPDWLLMQINTLSSLESSAFEEVCKLIVENLKTGDLDYNKLKEQRKAANFDMSAIKACTAGITFIFRSGISYGVPSRELGAELEQLGLEPHLSSILINVYAANFDSLRHSAMESMLSLPRPVNIKAKRGTGVTLDMTLEGMLLSEPKNVSIDMNFEQAALLLRDLKSVAARTDHLMGD